MTVTVKRGDHGPEVIRLQQLLHDHGHYDGHIDGSFGARTEVALKKHQIVVGLATDGVAGPDTWRSLLAAAGPQVGLRSPEQAERYLEHVYGPLHSSMTPQQRLDHLMGAALTELDTAGVPRPTYAFDPALASSGLAGRFEATTWHISANPDAFDLDRPVPAHELDLMDVANTIYHEARHAEQFFAMARAQAGLGHDASSLATTMHIPAHVAAIAVLHKINGSTVDGTTDAALAGYDMAYGAGAEHTADVYDAATAAGYDHATRDAYRQLTTENDAWETGGVFNEAYLRLRGIHATVELFDQGADVAHLRGALTSLGFLHVGPEHDEQTFDQAMHDALLALQSHFGLVPDGRCGPKTWLAISEHYAA